MTAVFRERVNLRKSFAIPPSFGNNEPLKIKFPGRPAPTCQTYHYQRPASLITKEYLLESDLETSLV
jgi:hypothetical protein